MLSKLFTISHLGDIRSNKSTVDVTRDKNEQQASPYDLYSQLRQEEKRRQLSIYNRGALLNLFRGIIARLLLIIVLIYLYLTAYCINEQDNKYIWLLSFLSVLIVIEGFIAIRYQQGEHEWHWFSPCIFIFIIIGLPPIWLIRFQEWSILASKHLLVNDSLASHITSDLISNETALSTSTCHGFKEFLETYSGISFGEQLLTICIVFIRWLLPIHYNEHINRFVYLEMLLFNVAIVSDIFEFTETILSNTNEEILASNNLRVLSMVAYSISLFLFTINLKAKKKHMSNKLKYLLWSYATIYQRINIIFDFLISSETWSCLIVLFILDLPFLIFRLIVLFHYHEHNFKMIFFIVKNFMIILIDIKLIYGYICEYKFQRSHYDHQEQITI